MRGRVRREHARALALVAVAFLVAACGGGAGSLQVSQMSRGAGDVSPAGDAAPAGAARDIVFQFGSTEGWTVSGLWHWISSSRNGNGRGNPCWISYSPHGAFWYGQDVSCDYYTGDTTAGNLTSPLISLAGFTRAQLRFRTWWNIEIQEPCCYDVRSVQVSTDGGSTWTTLGNLPGVSSSGGWVLAVTSLNAYVGQTVQIRFRFNSVDSNYNTHQGWYVDDVVISPNFTTGVGLVGGGGHAGSLGVPSR